MTNSTETARGSENGDPSATATPLPDKENKRTAKVQKGRTLTAVPKPSGSTGSRPASRRKSQPKPRGRKVKAMLGILTKEQRHEAGKALREKCPRKSHGEVVLGQGERDIVELIDAQNEDRLQNLVPVRHGRMVQSAFAYFRGTALIQAHDLEGYANQRNNCSFLRRLSSDEFRRLRDARAKYRLRYQRFRRDPARTVRMGS